MTEPENDIIETKPRFGRHTITKAVVGHSVRFVVVSTLATVVPVESRKDKLRLAIAGYALSGIVSDKAKEYVCNELDEKIEFVREVMAELNKSQDSPESDAVVIHTL